MAKFEYKKRSVEEIKKQEGIASSGGRDRYVEAGAAFFKPAQGLNFIRILPPGWENAEHYGYRVGMHYGIGVDKASYICPHTTVHPKTGRKEDCPICEEGSETDDAEYSKKLKPSNRVLVYILERNSKGLAIPKLWSMPSSVDKDILMFSVDAQTNEIYPVDDPFEGYDIELRVEGEGERTKYKVAVAKRPSEVKNFEEQVWPKISAEKSIPNLLIFQEYDYLKKVFSGKVSNSSVPQQKIKSVTDLTYDTLLKVKSMAGLDKVIQEYSMDYDVSEFDDYEDAVKDIAINLGFVSDNEQEEKYDESNVPEQGQEEVETPVIPKATTARPDLKSKLAELRNRK